MSATSRDYKVYKTKFEQRQKTRPIVELVEFKLKALTSNDTFFASGKDLKNAIARHFETELMRKISGISLFCRHGREWYSVTRFETIIKVERIY